MSAMSTDGSSAFQHAMKLPQGNYYTPKTAKITDTDAMLIRMNCVGQTNKTSECPVVGTAALSTCAGIAIRNVKTNMVIIEHESGGFLESFNNLLKRIRTNSTDMLSVDVIGAGKTNDTVSDRYTLAELDALAVTIAATPNARLRSFDVYDKPHPTAFAVDSRTGKLIRGTPNVTDAFTTEKENEDFFVSWDHAGYDVDYDGTTRPKTKGQRR
jgi:hypothetical protein